jgi:uncharacterized membrane protein (DUF485 family)
MTTPHRDTPSAADIAALAPDIRRIYQSEAFSRLRKVRGRLARQLTITMCVIYYGFILAIAFKPGWLAIKLDSVITLGIPVGLGVIVSAIVLTGIYVRRANSSFDSLAAEAYRSAKP